MSRLDELIRELCPDGVEYRTLGEITTISRGGNFQKKDFQEDGIPCIHYGQIYTKYGLFADKTFTFINEECGKKQKYAEKNDIVMAVTSENIEDVCKCLAWLGEDKVAVSGHSAIIRHNQNAKYLVYYFHSQMFFAQKRKLAHGTKVIEVTPDKLLGIKLPVPPLPVQQEIVRILDTFTALTSELTSELTAELTARKKQYEYYRDRLLSFDENEVQWKTLGEVVEIRSGWGFPNSEQGVTSGEIPFFKVSDMNNKGNETFMYTANNYVSPDVAKKLKCKPVPKGTIIFPKIGAAIATNKKRITTCEACYDNNVIGLIASNDIVGKFLFYIMGAVDLMRFADSSGAMPSIRKSTLEKFKIPIPPLEIQNRIVSILDRFDSLCNDLSSGIPAEIEARKKQYEYYRDKLLTFKEKPKEAV